MDEDKKPFEMSGESSWADSGFFLGTEGENSILSEFGWNMQQTTQEGESNNCFMEVDQIQLNQSLDEAKDLQLIPEKHLSSSITNQMVLRESVDVSTSNPSLSSSSSDDLPEKSTGSIGKPPDKQCKGRKKGQKRTRQPRFAFITKSDVDHLEDGYRWRKYGQKAVKNSPYPRSYYRCTNSKCTVKKRVERSCEDPTTVITTYEGQHCHHTVSFPRGGVFSHEAALMGRLNASASQMYHVQYPIGTPLGIRQPHQLQRQVGSTQLRPEPTSQLPSDEGLLGDIVRNR